MVAVVGFVVLLWLFSGVVIFHRMKDDDMMISLSSFKCCPKWTGNTTVQDYSSVLDMGWVGFGELPWLVDHCCCCLLPNQNEGTSPESKSTQSRPD